MYEYPYPLCHVLDSITAILQGRLKHEINHEGWYAIKEGIQKIFGQF